MSNFSAISCDDDVVCFVLEQHAQLDFYSASSLKQLSMGRHVTPHTLSWFWANQSLLLLINTAFLEEKQQIPIYSL